MVYQKLLLDNFSNPCRCDFSQYEQKYFLMFSSLYFEHSKISVKVFSGLGRIIFLIWKSTKAKIKQNLLQLIKNICEVQNLHMGQTERKTMYIMNKTYVSDLQDKSIKFLKQEEGFFWRICFKKTFCSIAIKASSKNLLEQVQ